MAKQDIIKFKENMFPLLNSIIVFKFVACFINEKWVQAGFFSQIANKLKLDMLWPILLTMELKDKRAEVIFYGLIYLETNLGNGWSLRKSY